MRNSLLGVQVEVAAQLDSVHARLAALEARLAAAPPEVPSTTDFVYFALPLL